MSLFFRRVIFGAATVFAFASAQAMSVIPPTFEQLIGMSETVVRGQVTEIHSAYAETSQGRTIKTFVTLHVERTLKGKPAAADTLTLVFLGGKIGADSLQVPGMPLFQTGDREIVFLWGNGHTVCPLLAAGHGRYRLLHDAASNRDYVARENHAPLESTDDVSLPLEAPAVAAHLRTPARALSPDDFETRIAAAVSRLPSPVETNSQN